jgi:hypothetical protein
MEDPAKQRQGAAFLKPNSFARQKATMHREQALLFFWLLCSISKAALCSFVHEALLAASQARQHKPTHFNTLALWRDAPES